jgi:hypothetical protein
MFFTASVAVSKSAASTWIATIRSIPVNKVFSLPISLLFRIVLKGTAKIIIIL